MGFSQLANTVHISFLALGHFRVFTGQNVWSLGRNREGSLVDMVESQMTTYNGKIQRRNSGELETRRFVFSRIPVRGILDL